MPGADTIYGERLSRLQEKMVSTEQSLRSDEAILLMKEDVVASAFIQQRVLEVVNSNLTSEREEFIQKLAHRVAASEREVALLEHDRNDLRLVVDKKEHSIAQADACIQELREQLSNEQTSHARLQKELHEERHQSEDLIEQVRGGKAREREHRDSFHCVCEDRDQLQRLLHTSEQERLEIRRKYVAVGQQIETIMGEEARVHEATVRSLREELDAANETMRAEREDRVTEREECALAIATARREGGLVQELRREMEGMAQAHEMEVQRQLAQAEKARGKEFCIAMLNVREGVKRLEGELAEEREQSQRIDSQRIHAIQGKQKAMEALEGAEEAQQQLQQKLQQQPQQQQLAHQQLAQQQLAQQQVEHASLLEQVAGLELQRIEFQRIHAAEVHALRENQDTVSGLQVQSVVQYR
jgi:hypothetical protein